MTAAELDLDPGSVAGQVHARLKWFSFAGVLATHLLLVGAVWGQWRSIAIITAAFVLVTGLNVVLAQRFFSERTRTAETFRLTLNMLANLVYGHFTDWALPVWLYLPFNCLWVDSHLERWTRYLLAGLVLLVGAVAVLDGCSPLIPLVFIVLSALAYAISLARVHLLRHVLERLAQRHQELSRAHEELDRAHERAREQEQLSSLGMLAAGIAHEINNPLSYVKSNVHCLHRDLKQWKALPPELGEYVTEVLPATMEGIRRIASIVTDLRRFACGEPEPLVEYELNQEVEAALRLTQGQLQPQWDVRVELAPRLPKMVGRPRQIAQVVTNLLVNAAHALSGHGTISVSTRQEGEEVVLVVRDTGRGMSAEVLSKLFQPFFTTKPLGEGMGMGLAVVHGIVAAHGGRIQVESQLGQGSTFTVRLPQRPPMTPPGARGEPTRG